MSLNRYFWMGSFCCSILLLSSISSADQTELDQLVASADAEAGRQIAAQCSACHSLEKGGETRVGPVLWEVVNRPIAGVQGFNYSPAMKDRKGNWDISNLDAFLASPSAFVPGTIMGFPGMSDKNSRANVIRFLHSLSDDPKEFVQTEQGGSVSGENAEDPFGSDWPPGDGRAITGYTCNACHSLAIVKQQGQTKKGWSELIDWMVEEQGMAEPADQDREKIESYLSENFNVNNE